MSVEVLDSPYRYTFRRDIWSLGIVVIQMISGTSVLSVYPGATRALEDGEFVAPTSSSRLTCSIGAADISDGLSQLIRLIFEISKKRPLTASRLFEKLSALGGKGLNPNRNSLQIPSSRFVFPHSSKNSN